MNPARALTLLLVYFCLSTAVKGDIIKLKNGDRVSGKILYLDVKIIMIATPYGKYNIIYRTVSHIEFSRKYRPEIAVHLKTGEKVYGRLSGSDPDHLHVQTDEKLQTFKWSDVVRVFFLRSGKKF